MTEDKKQVLIMNRTDRLFNLEDDKLLRKHGTCRVSEKQAKKLIGMYKNEIVLAEGFSEEKKACKECKEAKKGLKMLEEEIKRLQKENQSLKDENLSAVETLSPKHKQEIEALKKELVIYKQELKDIKDKAPVEDSKNKETKDDKKNKDSKYSSK